MSRNVSYATFSNRKARNQGVPTFKSWSQMSAEEKQACEAFEKLSYSELRERQLAAHKKDSSTEQ